MQSWETVKAIAVAWAKPKQKNHSLDTLTQAGDRPVSGWLDWQNIVLRSKELRSRPGQINS